MHTPIDGLALLVEYDSDTYAQEKTFGNFSPRSQVNYGLTYSLSDQTSLGLDWLMAPRWAAASPCGWIRCIPNIRKRSKRAARGDGAQ